MFTKKELRADPEYWLDIQQNEIYRLVEAYREQNGYNRAQLAKALGVSRSYVSQLLNGGFNHSLKKLIELAIKLGKVPVLGFEDIAPKGKGRIIALGSTKSNAPQMKMKLRKKQSASNARRQVKRAK